MSCTVSRDGETGKTRPRSGLAISHCEGSLIKGNGPSGNFECVFSVVFSACLGDSNSKTDAETIRASRRMFLLPLYPPPTPTPLALWLHIKVVDRVLKLILLFDSLKQLSVFKGAVASGCRHAESPDSLRIDPAQAQCRIYCTQAQMHTVSGPKNCCYDGMMVLPHL